MDIDGEAVRILRERTGISAYAFSSSLNISLSYLRDIETGRRKLSRSVALIASIAQELNVPIRMVVLANDIEQVIESEEL